MRRGGRVPGTVPAEKGVFQNVRGHHRNVL